MTNRIIIAVALLVLAMATMVAAEEKAWFDFENCDMCKNFADPPEMMKSMTWEQHKIEAGYMSVSTVPAEFLDAYRAANAKCEALGEKLKAGEPANMCGSCDAFGMLMAKGAKLEQVELSNGGIMLMTAGDAAVVTEMHAWVDKNVAAMADMTPPDQIEDMVIE
jgi:hypothetical protein